MSAPCWCGLRCRRASMASTWRSPAARMGGHRRRATLVNYSDRLRGGVDVSGIADFVSFLTNTAPYRQDQRRAEYGDERDLEMRIFLRRISPLTNADRITRPLLVVHGKNDP